jgi:hypothetical protein
MDDQLAAQTVFFAGRGGIANKDEVRLVAGAGECLGQARDAGGQTADLRIAVRSFE